jgi:polyisoprenoid-binding protein YceI
MKKILPLLALVCANVSIAAPATYVIDPAHTFPSFEADHMGLSMWRGKFNKNSGEVLLDKAAGTGSVDITIDATSIDFGLDAMNSKAREAELLDTAKFPTARYKGWIEFAHGQPARVIGALTLRGITKPVNLSINSFKCVPHPMYKRDYCGADAQATINRADFGMTAGRDYGFKMDVGLKIQVEAVLKE